MQDLPKNKCAAIAGKMTDAESLMAMKDLINKLGSELLATEQQFPNEGSGIDLRSNYLLNNKIKNIEDADVVLLIGTNPRYEAPLINTRLRKGYMHAEQTIGVIGPKVDLTYEYEVCYFILIFEYILCLKFNSDKNLFFSALRTVT